MGEKPKKTIWQQVTGWGVVGAVSLFLLGGGIGMMTSPHQYIADAFFFSGFLLLLVKFWAWEEAKHETTRKTAMLLAGVTLATIGLFVGACFLSRYVDTPKSPSNAVISQSGFIPQSKPVPTPASESKIHERMQSSGRTITTKDSHTQTKQQAPTYQQKCEGSACAQGPGSQATFNQYGLPKRDLDEAYISKIKDILSANVGSVYIQANTVGDPLASHLAKMFVDAKWDVKSRLLSTAPAFRDGVAVVWRGPTGEEGSMVSIPENRADIQAIFYVLNRSGVKGLSIYNVPDMPEHEVEIHIGDIPK